MKNMLDYIKEFGHVSFEERAFSEIERISFNGIRVFTT